MWRDAEKQAAPPADTGLECPACGYNLTGLAQNRCPECGRAFDPEELRRLCSPEIQPATPWDRGALGGFWATWKLAALAPTEFAANFPRRHNRARAVGYSWRCYVLASAILVVPITFTISTIDSSSCREVFIITLAASTCEIAAAWVCEAAIAGVLTMLVRPTLVADRYHFWRGLTHFTSGFLIISSATITLAALGAFSSPGVVFFAAFMALVDFLWWSAALGRMIWRRTRPGPGRALACMVVPLLGLMTIVGCALAIGFVAVPVLMALM